MRINGWLCGFANLHNQPKLDFLFFLKYTTDISYSGTYFVFYSNNSRIITTHLFFLLDDKGDEINDIIADIQQTYGMITTAIKTEKNRRHGKFTYKHLLSL